MRTPLLLLIQVVLLAMLAFDLWQRVSAGGEVPVITVVAVLGIAALAVLSLVRLRREREVQRP